jgi:hypothetical protein
MEDRDLSETGPLDGKWKDDDTLTWRGGDNNPPATITNILGTAHKGGLNQEQANSVLQKYEIFGWLDRDGDKRSGIGDNPDTGFAWLATNIGPIDTEILVQNIGILKDTKHKMFQGFMIDNELIVVEDRFINSDTSRMTYVKRGVNETQEVNHARGTPIFPVSFWELMYQIKVAGATEDDFRGDAVGYNTPPGTDEGTPGNLIQNGPLDLRPFSGEHGIKWLLRLRVVDIFGLSTESDMNLPSRPDMFVSTGPGAYFGIDGDSTAQVPAKRVLYVRQARPPKRPKIYPTQ